MYKLYKFVNYCRSNCIPYAYNNKVDISYSTVLLDIIHMNMKCHWSV